MYPKVFEDFMAATTEFGDLSALPTRNFVEPMEVGEEVNHASLSYQTVAAHPPSTRRTARSSHSR